MQPVNFSYVTDTQPKTPSVSEPQLAVQTSKPATIPPGVTASASKMSLHWSHALLAVGLLAASGAGTGVLFKVFCPSAYK